MSRARQKAIDALANELRVPKEWPAIRRTFEHVGFMKTTEAMQYAGPVGLYFLFLMDMSEQYRQAFVAYFSALEPLLHKVSIPDVRRKTRQNLTDSMFDLEMLLPHRWSSMVRHVMSDHSIDTIERCGPFAVNNMLCREAYQGVIKSLCRGSTAMSSIRVHSRLWEASMMARSAMPDVQWSVLANGSTVDRHNVAPPSEDRLSLEAAPVGKAVQRGGLDRESLKQVQFNAIPLYFSLSHMW